MDRQCNGEMIKDRQWPNDKGQKCNGEMVKDRQCNGEMMYRPMEK